MKLLMKYIAKFARIFTVTLIILVLIHCSQSFTREITRLFTYKPQPGYNTPDPAQRSILFLPDGTLHQIHSLREPNHPGQTMEEIYDANNTLIRSRPASDKPDSTYLSFAEHLYISYGRSFLNSQYTVTPSFSKTLNLPVFKNGTLQEIWRYDRSRGIFVGFDRSGTALGCLGQQGLRQMRNNTTGLGHLVGFQSRWSTKQGKQKLLWVTRHHLYEIDVSARQVNRLVDSNDSTIELVSVQAWYEIDKNEKGYVDPNLYRPLIVCRSSDRTYHLVLRDPNRVITFSAPEEWNQWYPNTCRFSATKIGLFLKHEWVEFPAPPFPFNLGSPEMLQLRQAYFKTKKHHWTELYRMNDQGQLEKVAQGGWMETRIDNNFRLFSKRELNTLRIVNCLSPGLYRWIIAVSGPQAFYALRNRIERNTLSHTLMETVSMFCPAATWDNLIISMVMVAIVFWHGRSRLISRKRLIFWLVFTVCFNLAGLLTYLALNHTAVILCPACGKKRGLEQDTCPLCGTALPEPDCSSPNLILT